MVLGTSGEKVLFSILKKDYGANIEEVAENPELLVTAIERLLGPAGRDLLVRLVSDELVKEFDLPKSPGEGNKKLSEILREAHQKDSPTKS